MKNPNFDWLKENIYNTDNGSLLDIYILNTKNFDLKIWYSLIKQYNPIIRNVELDKIVDVKKHLHFITQSNKSMSILFSIKHIDINSCLFDYDQIDNYFNPHDIKTIDDHNLLIDYLIKCSKMLDKEIIITPDVMKNIHLVTIYKDEIEYID